MELRQLKYFSEAAKTLNFTQAAHNLFITQSTLSQQIKQLEIELDIPLFDRIGKQVVLTEAGNAFLPYALKTLHQASSGKEKLRDLLNLHTGELHIGVTYSLSSLLTQTIVDFTSRYPNIRLHVVHLDAGNLLSQLIDHQFDFILTFLPPKLDDRLSAKPLFDSSLVMTLHEDHPLAKEKRVNWEMLEKHALILPEKGLSARQILDKIVDNEQISLVSALETNDVYLILQLIKTKKWVSFLSKATIVNQTDLKGIVIKNELAQMHASLIWMKEVYQKKSAIHFHELLIKNAQKHHII